MTRIPYRPEVDGLRAVAIVAVVFYHLGIPAFAGGFVGVDCFFVISGYLIFSLLYREQSVRGAIDWKAFYSRRITRLVPEATAVIVVVVLVGYFILLPTGPHDGEALSFRRLQLAQSGAAGALWVANLHFWQYGSGYFAPWSGREPLIHLWSLGVEEQFYLVVPLMFWLTTALSCAKRHRWDSWAWILLASAFVPSIACAVAYAGHWSAFYALPTRAYEFAIGAGLALWLGQPDRAAASPLAMAVVAALGAVAVGVSVLWLESAKFPGAWALLPTCGTAMMILGTSTTNLLHRVLTLRPVVYVGKISYGWYLWHWPLIVFWREYWFYDVSLVSELTIAAIALLPAAAGHYWVVKLRRRASSPDLPAARVFQSGALAVVGALSICGAIAWASIAMPVSPEVRLMNSRMHDGVQKASNCLKKEFYEGTDLPECPFGDLRGTPTVVLWGDSHAAAWLPGLEASFRERGIRGAQRILFGCPPGFVKEHPTSEAFIGCNRFNREVIREIVNRASREPIAVILAARWAGYVNEAPLAVPDRGTMPPGWAPGRTAIEVGLDEAIGKLTALGVPVGITQSVPELRYSAPVCLYRWPAERCGVARDVEWAYLGPAVEMVSSLAASRNLPVIDPRPLLCTQSSCRASAGDLVFYWDDDHLSASAMQHLREPVGRFVDALVGQQKTAQARAAALEAK